MKLNINSLILLLTFLLPVTATAYDFKVDGICYNITSSTDKTVEVTYDETAYETYIGSVNIPNTVKTGGVTYTVTAIGFQAFYVCRNLWSVTIPNSVTSIGTSAFSNCWSLKSISIPPSVTSIGDWAFSSCESLEYVTIPNSVKTLGHSMFSGCKLLERVTLPNTVTSIGDRMFSGCVLLKNFKIPSSVSSIGESAFSHCESMTSIQIPDSVNYIGKNAFYYCSELSGLRIPNSVTVIPESMCEHCTHLNSVTIPRSVTYIGSTAFHNCIYLNYVTCHAITPPETGAVPFGFGSGAISSNATLRVPGKSISAYQESSVWHQTFYNNIVPLNYDFELNDIYYHILNSNSVEVVNPGFNYFCDNETIPSKVSYENTTYSIVKIGNNAFKGCLGLTGNLIIPNTVTSIGSGAFEGCTGINSVSMGDTILTTNTVCTIGVAAFMGCTGLTDVSIGNTITVIGDEAFKDCTNIISVTLGNNVLSIESNAFKGCSNLFSVIIPKKVSNIGTGVFSDCRELFSLAVANGNSKYDSRNDCNAIIETATNTLFAGCMNTTIPNSVTSIGDYAFTGCSGLDSITFPSSVTSIGNHAFSGSGLANITIPETVNSIGPYAFYGCTGLTNATIGNSVRVIRECTFAECSELTSITLPNKITSIGDYSFDRCSKLANIIIRTIKPPVLKSHTFSNYDATLLVPPGSISSYESAEYWNNFPVIEGICCDFEVNGIYYEITGSNLVSVAPKSTSYNSYSNSVIIPSDVMYNGETYKVNSISDLAFKNCTGLTSLTIPSSITTIGKSIFQGCSELESLNFNASSCADFSQSANDQPFYNLRINTINIGDSVLKIPSYFVSELAELLNVSLGKSVTSIGNYAFYKCKGLKSVIIPNSVISIGSSAFKNCKDLSSITIGNSVKTIGDAAFNECLALDTLIYNATSSDGFSSNASHPFYNTNISNITIGDDVKKIPSNFAFGLSKLSNLSIGNSVSSIGESAFYKCSSLTSVSIPSSVREVGASAFAGCTSLSSVHVFNIADWCEINFANASSNPLSLAHHLYLNESELSELIIPNIVTAISDYSFNGCYSLAGTLTIPNSVKLVGACAFRNCSGLDSVIIGDSVSSIGDNAFSGCYDINNVTCQSSDPPSMYSESIFENSCYQNAVLSVPARSYHAYRNAEYWNRFSHIVAFGDDVNGDGEWNIGDINAVIDLILSGEFTMAGDVNGDGELNIADINAIIGILLGS